MSLALWPNAVVSDIRVIWRNLIKHRFLDPTLKLSNSWLESENSHILQIPGDTDASESETTL
jgi:hypothetical protein